MWWFSPQLSQSRLLFAGRLLAVIACLLPLALTSCGFHPLYGKDSYNATVQNDLASVEILPLKDRTGQLVHNALLTNFNPLGEPTKARYRLLTNVIVGESQQALRKDDTATRNRITYSVAFYLYENNAAVMTGSFSQMFSYDFLDQHYANVSADDDIHRRAAQSVADEIRNRVAAYFAKAAEVKAKSGSGH
ncbi:MAG TPA: LPS assembly lipoprotein LptE [Telmatospirillum sp.]|nr:LPS assembly lipoprotein LptE [Telmatospirillum sp.]